MQKLHVTVIALLLAGAAVFGAVAVARTTGLGSAARQSNDAAFAARVHQLSTYAAKLRKELRANLQTQAVSGEVRAGESQQEHAS